MEITVQNYSRHCESGMGWIFLPKQSQKLRSILEEKQKKVLLLNKLVKSKKAITIG